jgi:ferritin-like metal-binding protein YciE
MKLHSLEDLFHEQLRDMFDAEKQLVKALPKMAKAAAAPELREAFEEHLEQTREHVERLERVFELIGKKARGKSCAAMAGLVEEGADIIDADGEPMVLDAGLIAAAQRVEHYEMAGYGCLRTWAQQMGNKEVARILEKTLNEEKETDQKLTDLAENLVNLAAQHETQNA